MGMRKIVHGFLPAIFSLKRRLILRASRQARFVSRYALLRGFIASLIVASGTVPSLLVVWKVYLWNKYAYYLMLAILVTGLAAVVSGLMRSVIEWGRLAK